jgi:hypothetical protein
MTGVNKETTMRRLRIIFVTLMVAVLYAGTVNAQNLTGTPDDVTVTLGPASTAKFRILHTGGAPEFFRVDAGGNVGIGTTTPPAILTAQKANATTFLGLSGDAGSYADISLGRAAGEVRLAIAAGPGQFSPTAIAGDAILRVEGSSKRLLLMTGTSYPTMTITNTSVGIDAFSPTARLEIGAWQSPTQFLDGVSQGLADGILLKMPGNSEIHVGGLQIGETALPIIQTIPGPNAPPFSTPLLLNYDTDNEVIIGRTGHTRGLNVASIGMSTFAGSVTVTGALTAGTVYANYQDLAEWVPAAESMLPGTVVVISNDTNNTVTASTHAYDTGVAGVVSRTPGLLLGVASDSKAKIATTGRVKVRVDANKGPIQKGDLLVTSDRPGMAMKSEPLDLGGTKIHRPGTLIGKALEPLASGEGEILVLLSLQ